MIIAIDCSVAGIAGDMFSAALIDLFEDKSIPKSILEDITRKIDGLEIKTDNKNFESITGTYLSTEGEKQEIDHSELLEKFEGFVAQYDLKEVYLEFGRTILNILIEAEKSLHQPEHPEDFHLHELGTVDTLLDTIVPTLLLSRLQVSHVIISPVATGTGVVNTSHGSIPVPSPATQYLLEKGNIGTVVGPQGEATTPTGAAILYSLQKNFPSIDSVVWNKSGYGFGTKTWSDRGNFLRIRLGELSKTKSSVTVLETNIDDISGELLGYAMDKLMDLGALDVSYSPIVMKKSRPAYLLRVISKNDQVDEIAEEIMKLTGTLGIRVLSIDRHIGERKLEKKTRIINEQSVNYKIKQNKYAHKVEFDDLRRISEELDISIIKLKQILEGDETRNE